MGRLDDWCVAGHHPIRIRGHRLESFRRPPLVTRLALTSAARREPFFRQRPERAAAQRARLHPHRPIELKSGHHTSVRDWLAWRCSVVNTCVSGCSQHRRLHGHDGGNRRPVGDFFVRAEHVGERHDARHQRLRVVLTAVEQRHESRNVAHGIGAAGLTAGV